MTKEDLYHDFLLIKEMKSPMKKKVMALTHILGSYNNCWRVVGISENALDVFAKNEFRKVSRMGINRSHLVDRCKIYEEMFLSEKNCDDWWNFYLENDKTILTTASENISKNVSQIFEIDQSLGLFQTQGFAWRHTRKERKYLENLYKSKSESNIYSK